MYVKVENTIQGTRTHIEKKSWKLFSRYYNIKQISIKKKYNKKVRKTKNYIWLRDVVFKGTYCWVI